MSNPPLAYVLDGDAPVEDPFPVLDPDAGSFEVVEGEPEWRVHWLRQTEEPGGPVHAGLFTSTAGAVRFTFDMNEVVYCLEGEAQVEVEGAQTVELRPGTFASFEKGSTTTWRIPEWFKELFVVSP